MAGEEPSKHQIDVQISTKFLDIPYLHNEYRKESKDFISALSKSKKEQIDLFATPSIQAIIAHRWRDGQRLLVWAQLIPYIFFQITFLFYS